MAIPPGPAPITPMVGSWCSGLTARARATARLRTPSCRLRGHTPPSRCPPSRAGVVPSGRGSASGTAQAATPSSPRSPVGTALNSVGAPTRRARRRFPPGPRNLNSSTNSPIDIRSTAEAPRSSKGTTSSTILAMSAATCPMWSKVARIFLTRNHGSEHSWRYRMRPELRCSISSTKCHVIRDATRWSDPRNSESRLSRMTLNNGVNVASRLAMYAAWNSTGCASMS